MQTPSSGIHGKTRTRVLLNCVEVDETSGFPAFRPAVFREGFLFFMAFPTLGLDWILAHVFRSVSLFPCVGVKADTCTLARTGPVPHCA
jgi:hypothetical protein